MIYIFFYKITCLLVGLVLCWMGYQLFVKGIFQGAGNVTTSWDKFKLVVTKAAPGLYFVLFGTIVIAATVYKGLEQLEAPVGVYRNGAPLTISGADSLPVLKDSTTLKTSK